MDHSYTIEIGQDTFTRRLDPAGSLQSLPGTFVIKIHPLIYLDGNSLGRLPAETVKYLENAIREQWGERLIRSWNEGWYQQSMRLGKKIAQIIGARPDEVILSDSTSVNLYKLAYGALKLQEGRS